MTVGVTNMAIVKTVRIGHGGGETTWVGPRAYILFLDWDGRSALRGAIDGNLVMDLCGGTPGKSFTADIELIPPIGAKQPIERATALWPNDRTFLLHVDLRQHQMLFERQGIYQIRLQLDGQRAATLSIPIYGLEAATE